MCVYKHAGVRLEKDRSSEAQEPCFLSLMFQFSNISPVFSSRQFITQNGLVSKSVENESLFYKCFQSGLVV